MSQALAYIAVVKQTTMSVWKTDRSLCLAYHCLNLEMGVLNFSDR